MHWLLGSKESSHVMEELSEALIKMSIFDSCDMLQILVDHNCVQHHIHSSVVCAAAVLPGCA